MALITPIDFVSKKGKTIRIRNLEVSEALKLRDAMVKIAKNSPYILSTSESFQKRTQEDQEKFISSHNDKERSLLIVAEHEQQIIGVYNFVGFVNNKQKHRGGLGISLHHEYRKEGIAKKLFEVSIQTVRKFPGLEYVELDLADVNHEAFELYKRVGFQVTSQIPDSYRLEDGRAVGNISMRLKLADVK